MTTARSRTKRIGLRDRLGQLTYRAACRLMGEKDGEARLQQGAGFDINIAHDVYLSGDTLRVNVPDFAVAGQRAIVTIVEMTNRPKGLYMQCDRCETRCDHIAAVLSLVLDAKGPLGLSAPPDPSEPIELLTEEELFRRALADRQERAAKEKMTLRALTPDRPWSDYTITSHESGKTYRVSLRGFQAGESYCSCPDFRTNHLGTCKHILHAQAKLHTRFSKKQLATPYRRKGLSLRLDYGHVLGLRFNLPSKPTEELMQLLGSFAQQTVEDVPQLMTTLRALEKGGYAVHVYPDAEEFIDQRLLQHRLVMAASEIRSNPAQHPLRNSLLRVELLPYQLDGIAFAVGAGRAVLADDMGLGKTIQGIGVAELLARLADIRRVLVVCPASLKSQWRNEINRFADRSSQIVLGNAEERLKRYHGDAFFTICNYEQVIRDCTAIEGVPWDLIILDEGQRIKNWQTKTSQVIKSLKSRFALVLSGTPLENRLEELYTVVTFIDDRRLGPIHRFLHQHRVVDERGRVEGYRNLDLLRHQLKPVMLRRTRAAVMQQLPERSTEVVRIRPTEEQKSMSHEFLKMVSRIVRKPYLTEMDLLRLQKFLLLARMAADSSFLVDKKKPGYSSKLERITELLEQLAAESDRKILIFSEWTTMLGLIEPILKRVGLPFVRLDGQVPQNKRQQIVHEFQHNDACKVLLMSNAGNTGLNLQAANTVINVDLPWNPAVLEQRIARAHRMGQQQPVQVYILVTEDTIEERMLGTLSAKHDLALAALDVDSDVTAVELSSGLDELKRRLEQLLGEKPTAPVDASMQCAVVDAAQEIHQRRERVASAGGELLGAALKLVGELIDTGATPDPQAVTQLEKGLNDCVVHEPDGKLQVRFTLPNQHALRDLATVLAKLLVADGPPPGP